MKKEFITLSNFTSSDAFFKAFSWHCREIKCVTIFSKFLSVEFNDGDFLFISHSAEPYLSFLNTSKCIEYCAAISFPLYDALHLFARLGVHIK